MPPGRARGGAAREKKVAGLARLAGNWRDRFAALKDQAGTRGDWVVYLVGSKDSQLGGIAKRLKQNEKYKGRGKTLKLRQLAEDIGIPSEILTLDPSKDEWPGTVFTPADDERLRELLTPAGQQHYGYVRKPAPEREESPGKPAGEEERKYGRESAAAEEEPLEGGEEPLEPFSEFTAAPEFSRPGRHAREVDWLLETLQGAEGRDRRAKRDLRGLRREALEISLGAKLDKPERRGLFAQLQDLAVNRFAPQGLEYKYVGSQTDLLGNIENGVIPLNALDEAAFRHDFAYLKIAAERARGDISDSEVSDFVEQVDRALAIEANKLIQAAPGSLEADAARLVRAAMTLKTAGGRVLPTWVGVATPLTEEEAEERETDIGARIRRLFEGRGTLEDWPRREEALQAAVRLTHEIASEEEGHAHARTETEEKEGAGSGGGGGGGAAGSASTSAAPGGGGSGGGAAVASGGGAVSSAPAVAPTNPAASPEAAAAGGAVRAESRYTSIGAQGAIDMLGTKIQGFLPAEPIKPSMLQPVTGERVLALSVPIGDSPDVVALTAKERTRADTFYSRFKNVASGMGNGNQQLMPWEVAHRTNNCLIDAVSGGERVKYSGPQFTGGATLPIVKVLGRQDRVAFRVPMINDRAGPTAFLRDSPATAARGREIQMSSEQMPDTLLTQKQWLNSVGQRLVRPSVTAGRRN